MRISCMASNGAEAFAGIADQDVLYRYSLFITIKAMTQNNARKELATLNFMPITGLE